MSICACGRIKNGSQSVCDLCSAVGLFGLPRGATQSEIKDAYRVLAKVWHPDRFPADEELRAKAEEKLKQINSAYQLLTTTATEATYESAKVAAQPSRDKSNAWEGKHSSSNVSSAADSGCEEKTAPCGATTAAAPCRTPYRHSYQPFPLTYKGSGEADAGCDHSYCYSWRWNLDSFAIWISGSCQVYNLGFTQIFDSRSDKVFRAPGPAGPQYYS